MQLLPQTASGLFIDGNLHSCGIRFTTGDCHANNTPRWLNILENLRKGFLQQWHHELSAGYHTGSSGQSKTTCRRIYFCPAARSVPQNGVRNFFYFSTCEQTTDPNKGHPSATAPGASEGHINAPLAFNGRLDAQFPSPEH